MYEALPKIPEGWGDVRKNPFRGGGMDIFWNYTLLFYGHLYHTNLYWIKFHAAPATTKAAFAPKQQNKTPKKPICTDSIKKCNLFGSLVAKH